LNEKEKREMVEKKSFLGEIFSNGGTVAECECPSHGGVYIIVYNGTGWADYCANCEL